MDKKGKSKKGKSDDLPDISDYERSELEKFDRDDYEYHGTPKGAKTFEEETSESLSITTKSKFRKSRVGPEEDKSGKLMDSEDGTIFLEEKLATIQIDAKKSKKITTTGDKSNETTNSEENLESSTKATAVRRRKPDNDEQTIEDSKSSSSKSVDGPSSQKPKKKLAKSPHDLPEIPDYHRPDLEYFDKEDHEFSYEAKSRTKETGILKDKKIRVKKPKNKDGNTTFDDEEDIFESADEELNSKVKKYEDQKSDKSSESIISKPDEQESDSKKSKANKGVEIKTSPSDSKESKNVPRSDKSPKTHGKPSKLKAKKGKEDLSQGSDVEDSDSKEYQGSSFEPSRKIKSKKSKSSAYDLPEIPDYEKPELEKFDKEYFDWGNDNDDRSKEFSKGSEISNDDLKRQKSRKPKDHPSEVENKSNYDELKSKDDIPNKKGSEDQKSPTDKISKSGSGDQKETKDGNEPSKPQIKKGKESNFPGMDEKDNADTEESFLDSSNKKKSKALGEHDLPEIPDYEKLDLESFDKEVFTWGDDKDEKAKPFGKGTKSFEESVKKSKLRKSKNNPLDTTEAQDVEPDQIDSENQDDGAKSSFKKSPMDNSKVSNNISGKNKELNKSGTQKVGKDDSNDFSANPDNDSPKCEDNDEIPFDTSRKSKPKKPKLGADGLPEISDYEKPELETFDKEDFSWGASDDENKGKPSGITSNPAKSSSKKPKSIKHNDNPNHDSDDQDNVEECTSKDIDGKTGQSTKKGSKRSSIEDDVSKDLKNVAGKPGSAPDEISPPKAKTKKSKNDDLPNIPDNDQTELEKYQKTPFDSGKKIKTKKPKASTADDLPEIPDYEPPKLEKFNRDDYKMPKDEDTNPKSYKRKGQKNDELEKQTEETSKSPQTNPDSNDKNTYKVGRALNKPGIGSDGAILPETKNSDDNIEPEEFTWGGSDDEIKVKPFSSGPTDDHKGLPNAAGKNHDSTNLDQDKSVKSRGPDDKTFVSHDEEHTSDNPLALKLKKTNRDEPSNTTDESKPLPEKSKKSTIKPSQKTKATKASMSDDLPEIPDYEPAKLEKFERDDYKLPTDDTGSKTPKRRGHNNDNVEIKSDEPTKRTLPGDNSDKNDGTLGNPANPTGNVKDDSKPFDQILSQNPSYVDKPEDDEFSWGNEDDEPKIKLFGRATESSGGVRSASKCNKNTDELNVDDSKILKSSENSPKDDKTSSPKNVPHTQDEKKSKSDISPLSKTNTKRKVRSDKSELPEILDYERPQLEKFDKDNLWSQDIKMSEPQETFKDSKENARTIDLKDKPSSSSKMKSIGDQNNPDYKNGAPTKNIDENEKPITAKSLQDVRNDPAINLETNVEVPVTKERPGEIAQDGKNVDRENYNKPKIGKTEPNSKEIDEILDYERPELEKYEKGEFASNKKSKERDTVSRSGKDNNTSESLLDNPSNISSKHEADSKNPRSKDDKPDDSTERKQSLTVPGSDERSRKSSLDNNQPNVGSTDEPQSAHLRYLQRRLQKQKSGEDSSFNPTKKDAVSKDEKINPTKHQDDCSSDRKSSLLSDEKSNPYKKQEDSLWARKASLDKTKEEEVAKRKDDEFIRKGSSDKKLNPYGNQEDSLMARKSSLDKSKDLDSQKKIYPDDKLNPVGIQEDSPWMRKSGLEKPDESEWKSSISTRDDDNKGSSLGRQEDSPWVRTDETSQRKLSLTVEIDEVQKSSLSDIPASPEILDEAHAANLRYLQRRLKKQLSQENTNVTAKLPKDSTKISSTAEPATADILSKYKPSLAEEATSKNIQVKDSRDAPIAIMITEPESPTDKSDPKFDDDLKFPKIISKPGPRNPRYDPLAFVPEDEELPPQSVVPQPTTPTSPSSPAKTKYNPFQYDLDDDETQAEKVNTHKKLCNRNFYLNYEIKFNGFSEI